MWPLVQKAVRRLPSRAVHVQRLRLLLCGGPLYFLGGLLVYFFPAAGAVWLILCFAISAAALFYIPAYCRSVAFFMDVRSLLIRKGVFFRKTICISWDRVQYLRIVVTPAAKHCNTASVFFLMTGQLIWLGEISKEQSRELLEVFNEAHDAQNTSAGDTATT